MRIRRFVTREIPISPRAGPRVTIFYITLTMKLVPLAASLWRRVVHSRQIVYSPARRWQHTSAVKNEEEQERHCWLLETVPKLYDTHIPSSIVQRIVLAAGSAVGALADPKRDGQEHSFNVFNDVSLGSFLLQIWCQYLVRPLGIMHSDTFVPEC